MIYNYLTFILYYNFYMELVSWAKNLIQSNCTFCGKSSSGEKSLDFLRNILKIYLGHTGYLNFHLGT